MHHYSTRQIRKLIMAEEKNGSTASISYFSSTTTLVHDDHKVISAKISELRIEEVYDPYQNRDLQHPNGFLGAFMHIVKTSLGTGILAIPRAFKNAGLLVGLFGTLLVGIICTHAIHILVKASQKVCSKTKTPSLGFADTAEGVFKLGPPALHKWSRFAKYFVEGGLFCIHYLADAVYLVIISVSLTKFFKVYYPSTETWDEYIFKLILFVPLLICGQVRQLKHLVPFSFIANLMLIVTFGITAYYMFSGISEISIKDRSLAAGISGIPSFFSTVLFSMEGIGTIMPVENSMVKPKFLGCHGVLNSAMMVIISLYASIGFFGYYKFGEGTEATITKNLPDDIPAQVVQIAIAIAVFFSYMLVFYVPVDIIWSNIKDKIPQSRHNISQIILRSVLITVNVGIAIAGGDHLGTLIDLIGAIFLSTLGFFVPALLDTIICYEEGWGVLHWRLIKNIFIMVLSVFGLVSGSYYAILEL